MRSTKTPLLLVASVVGSLLSKSQRAVAATTIHKTDASPWAPALAAIISGDDAAFRDAV